MKNGKKMNTKDDRQASGQHQAPSSSYVKNHKETTHETENRRQKGNKDKKENNSLK